MKTFSALLALCARNSSVTGEFPSQRPVTRSFDVFFGLHLNKRLSKQSNAGDLRRHCANRDVFVMFAAAPHVDNPGSRQGAAGLASWLVLVF